ncbi:MULTISPECIES: PLP-dependent aminotransferase family protein [unclassified Crossiella]|uniref:aminotransferase-like domain-containing protein n=1 Tax=unclassified Crossiella TaxID=2620835 RepID=UPI002000349C|nr:MULTISPECIES: PLP-dependent aminotransferase family protein [unclassified Crossiella]MCK2242651.1 PLP-dependent aminotransferase family protein [Crossiella sp. S99.2]MCK2256528.1 PLP-dependent aminotransferase family protein [Crossiella sp. S99.1]
MRDYRVIADRIAAEIAAGRLRPGDRLPPQRQFARRRGIAGSTAARVYSELVRRGLVVGEVGRGTFVRAAEPAPTLALAEPAAAPVDLELNFPVLPGQPEQLAAALAGLTRPDVFAAALRPLGVTGDPDLRAAAAIALRRGDWTPEPGRILFSGNGRQGLAAAISALVPTGGRLGVEALTYPVIKGIAARLGVTLVPLPMDEHGVLPAALDTVPAAYLQPTLHNPLGVTMPEQRRVEVAEALRRNDIPLIEDGVYGFLRPELPPLAALAPERTVLVDSLSKRLAPGLTLGFVVSAPESTDRLAAALRSGAWAAPAFAMAAARHWLTDGTASAIESAKRADATARQTLAAQHLAGFTRRADPAAYHCWWELPAPWRAETFVAAAARRGIAVTPAAAFAVVPGHAPNAVRLALSAPPLGTLAAALRVLAELARGVPEDTTMD